MQARFGRSTTIRRSLPRNCHGEGRSEAQEGPRSTRRERGDEEDAHQGRRVEQARARPPGQGRAGQPRGCSGEEGGRGEERRSGEEGGHEGAGGQAGGQARGEAAHEEGSRQGRSPQDGGEGRVQGARAEGAPAKPEPAKPEPAKPEPAKKAPPRRTTVICPLSGFEVKPDKPNLSPRTIDRLRTRLLEERARHVAQADELQAEAAQLALDREEGDTQFDEEGGEGDTISVERERDLMLSASARQIVDEIDGALERIRNKTYGLCAPAGRRISVERLEALPYAETCVDCKARAERRR